jgi:glycosyltransferase involved in cell wall biosynthesis
VHEYLARRSDWLCNLLPKPQSEAAEQTIEDLTMALAARFYSLAQVLFAPNLELCALLEKTTQRPCHLMPRGVNSELFNPARRNRPAGDREFVLGFVGRLSIEKNVQLLGQVQAELERMGHKNFRFHIIGHGTDAVWLRDHMPRVQLPGVLRGEALAEAYANMDLFVFPSHTDTFGNVVLEAFASGVPAIVTPDGGPASIVRDGVTGRIVPDAQFASAVAGILADPAKLAEMGRAARAHALTASWDSVFEGVYRAYEGMMPAGQVESDVGGQETRTTAGLEASATPHG